ncbi:AprI/Inh family metalloprotease inhibitor [Bartonella sp. B30(2025)]
MTFSKKIFFIALSAITVLSGCSKQQFNNNSQGGVFGAFYPVQKMSTLEKMSDLETLYSLESEKEGSSVYGKKDSHNDESVANLELKNRSSDLSPASIAGVWNLSMDGTNCRIATPQTKFGQGYRAAPLRCSGSISRINSWGIKGKKLYFYDKSGRMVIVLYSSNLDRFEGYTSDDQPVILSR